MSFSIVIATFNRLSDLITLIRSLIHLESINGAYEIIIVDSGTYNISEAQNQFKHHNNIKFILNAPSGASIQRNIGAREAQGKYLAFIDDDAIAHKDWLISVSKVLSEEIGVYGGKILPIWTKSAKIWHKNSDFIKSMYSLFDLGNKPKYFGYFFSCNLIIEKLLFDQIGGFDINHGRVGDHKILYGEDTMLCINAGKYKKNLYVPKAVVYHKVLDYRLKSSWLIKRAYYGGLSKSLLKRKPKPYKKLYLSAHDYALIIPYCVGYILGFIMSILHSK